MSERPRQQNGAEQARTPKTDADVFHDRLRRVCSHDLSELASDCQQDYTRRQTAVLQARYENAGVAVSLIYAVRRSPDILDRFNDAFEKQFGREPKADKLNREVFLFLYGETRKGMAGTDAMALSNAIGRGVPPHKIPAYIKTKGGLEKLLRAERSRRDPLEIIEIYVKRSVLKHLDELDLGQRAGAILVRSLNEEPAKSKFAIMQIK